MGLIHKLDRTGDTKTEWNPADPEEVRAAREVFDTLRKQGYAAARMEGETAGEIIREFDPSAGVVVMMPAMQGG